MEPVLFRAKGTMAAPFGVEEVAMIRSLSFEFRPGRGNLRISDSGREPDKSSTGRIANPETGRQRQMMRVNHREQIAETCMFRVPIITSTHYSV